MRRKLTLDPDTLQVASFEAGPSLAEAHGTVEAREGKILCAWSAVLRSCPGTVHTCISYDFCRSEDDGAIL
jgi:hypothetical protein